MVDIGYAIVNRDVRISLLVGRRISDRKTPTVGLRLPRSDNYRYSTGS